MTDKQPISIATPPRDPRRKPVPTPTPTPKSPPPPPPPESPENAQQNQSASNASLTADSSDAHDSPWPRAPRSELRDDIIGQAVVDKTIELIVQEYNTEQAEVRRALEPELKRLGRILAPGGELDPEAGQNPSIQSYEDNMARLAEVVGLNSTESMFRALHNVCNASLSADFVTSWRRHLAEYEEKRREAIRTRFRADPAASRMDILRAQAEPSEFESEVERVAQDLLAYTRKLARMRREALGSSFGLLLGMFGAQEAMVGSGYGGGARKRNRVV
jgi:hypothetical protein